MLKDDASEEPEGYFDLQDEAIKAGRLLASRKKVKLVIHAQIAPSETRSIVGTADGDGRASAGPVGA
jgi:hypothetical protein